MFVPHIELPEPIRAHVSRYYETSALVETDYSDGRHYVLVFDSPTDVVDHLARDMQVVGDRLGHYDWELVEELVPVRVRGVFHPIEGYELDGYAIHSDYLEIIERCEIDPLT